MVDNNDRSAGRPYHDLTGVTVGVLGLTFKAGTDYLR
jgi:UDP-glucose 6-dehydrogenase